MRLKLRSDETRNMNIAAHKRSFAINLLVLVSSNASCQEKWRCICEVTQLCFGFAFLKFCVSSDRSLIENTCIRASLFCSIFDDFFTCNLIWDMLMNHGCVSTRCERWWGFWVFKSSLLNASLLWSILLIFIQEIWYMICEWTIFECLRGAKGDEAFELLRAL